MSDGEPIDLQRRRQVGDTLNRTPASIVSGNRTAGTKKPKPSFNRHELNQILNIYGRRVSEGEWRDYAIDSLSDRAIFSIFRKASEVPLYRIEKQPALNRKQGAYSVITPTGLILKRGHELKNVLKVLEKKPKLIAV